MTVSFELNGEEFTALNGHRGSNLCVIRCLRPSSASA
jgi:hypothetical protein